MDNPNVLVFSNNCFSKCGSNGRTLANFFKGWPKNRLAQFYIHSEFPDSDVCSNYFRVTDSEALNAFLKGKDKGQNISVSDRKNKTNRSDISKKKIKRTPLTFLLRDLVWSSNRWRGDKFNNWINEFKPDLILIQVGDCSFMINLALNVAKERNIPLVIYNSEGYYFKEKNYFKESGMDKFLYPFLYRKYKRTFEKLMNYSIHTIYNCDMLRESYSDVFDHESTVIMTGSEISPIIKDKDNREVIISYLGNLGVGRHENLIEISNALQSINSQLKLDIYGKIPNEEIAKAFELCNGINYHGFIEYDEVIDKIKNSDIIVHGENFNDFYKWDLKYAFSTKIADSLSSGSCFLMYAPDDIASTQYLLKNRCACTVTNKNELVDKLKELIENKDLRNYYSNKAIKIASKNHNFKINRQKFQQILISLVRK